MNISYQIPLMGNSRNYRGATLLWFSDFITYVFLRSTIIYAYRTRLTSNFGQENLHVSSSWSHAPQARSQPRYGAPLSASSLYRKQKKQKNKNKTKQKANRLAQPAPRHGQSIDIILSHSHLLRIWTESRGVRKICGFSGHNYLPLARIEI